MRVGVAANAGPYPAAPFSPGQSYPEYPFAGAPLSSANGVYHAVRLALFAAGFDAGRFGTPAWNPLGDWIIPGSRVLLKPNFVNHFNFLVDDAPHREALTTHGSVIRAVLDFVYVAARGRCDVTLADLPIQSADFDALQRGSGVPELLQFIRRHGGSEFNVTLMDLRRFRLVCDRSGAIVRTDELPGDPRGYVDVDLGKFSEFAGLEHRARAFRVSDYEGDTTERLHSGGRHVYVLPRSVLRNDVVVNLPKMKTHAKVGVTLSLKNLVGTIGDKSCLPHFQSGAPEEGGDEFPAATRLGSLESRYAFRLRKLGPLAWRILRPLGRAVRRMRGRGSDVRRISAGDWFGNDTAWRMVHDLNRVILYADADGTIREVPQRKYVTIVDGVIAGDGDGPLRPRPVPSGVLVAGSDPLAVDTTCAHLMGFESARIPLLSRYTPGERPFSRFGREVIEIRFGETQRPLGLEQLSPVANFVAPAGWIGHIEQQSRKSLAR